MATIFQTANSIGPGARVTLASLSDWYSEVGGIIVAATDGSDAIVSSANAVDTLQIAGQVVGNNAINFTGTFSTLLLTNAASGYIAGAAGYGLMSAGYAAITNNGEITGGAGGLNLKTGATYNYGQIETPSQFGPAVGFFGTGTVYNFGTLSGFTGINFDIGSSSNFVYNSGTIRGSSAGIYDKSQNAATTDKFYNVGTIVSESLAFIVSGPTNTTFINNGSMTGQVQIAGGTNLFISTLGQVFGVITVTGASNTVVGGVNGGVILGAAGNDVLYANPTQTTADGAAKVTLSAGGGTNALYGSGAFTTFVAGTSNGGYNQIWGGASKMAGIGGYANNTLSFIQSAHGVYVDLLNGHNAYVSSGTNWTGAGTFEDSIVNAPNVVGSSHGDLIQADNGTDRIAGSVGADALYAGSGGASQDTFVYGNIAESSLMIGYDTIVGFKLGVDKIDLSAFTTDASHLALSTAGTSNTVYLETTAGTLNPNTDLALVVNTTAAGGLHASDFVF